MLTHTQFSEISYQAGIFTPKIEFRIAIILKTVLSDFSEIFDADPEIFPIEDDFPPEIPRIQLKNKNRHWQLQIAKSRLDIVADSRHVDSSAFYLKAVDLFEKYRVATRASIGRLAAVTKRLIEVEDAGRILAEHFCLEKWLDSVLNRPQDFRLHAFKCYKIDEQIPTINSWIRHNVGEVEILGIGKKQGVIVEQDLNTPAEALNSTEYDLERIRYFFHKIPLEMNDILKKYYPEVNNG